MAQCVPPPTDTWTSPSSSLPAPSPPSPRAARWRPAAVDVAVVGALLVAAVAVRRAGLPTDGLLFDDAWVVAGATKGGPSDLGVVATNHPGFSAGLMVWARAVSRRSELFALPALVAGVVAPPLAYGVLRSLRLRRAVAAAAATLVVAAPAHVVYSGRVKPYTAETLLGLGLVALVPRLAVRRWTPAGAAAWVLGAVVVGTTSAFTAVLLLAAGATLALHPHRDRVVRTVATAVQAALQVPLLVGLSRSYDAAQVARDWETTYDGYVELDPARSVPRQVVTHVRRLGQALVDVGSAPALVLAVLALVGLAGAARRGGRAEAVGVDAAPGPEGRRVAARFLLLLVALAAVGALVRQVPFGPSVGNPVFPGGRATLWLLPALVGGVALAVDAAVARVPGRALRTGAATGVAVVAVAAAVATAPWALPTEGSTAIGVRTVAEVVAEAGPGALVVLLPTATVTYAAEPGRAMDVVAEPSNLQGFVVEPTAPRTVLAEGWDGTDRGLAALVDGAARVVVVDGFTPIGAGLSARVDAALARVGYREAGLVTAGWATASTWRRPDP